MTGIAKILFDTLRTFAGWCVRQERLHQFIVTLQNVVLSSNLVSVALLIILWSTVQVCHALPFRPSKSLCKTLQSDFFVGNQNGRMHAVTWPLNRIQQLRIAAKRQRRGRKIPRFQLVFLRQSRLDP